MTQRIADHSQAVRDILTSKEYEAWKAVEVDGISTRRLARMLAISPSAVRTRLVSARAKIADYASTQTSTEPPTTRLQSRLSTITINLLIQRDGPKCYLCHRSFQANQLNVEHIIPTCKGGTDEADNIALACPSCNGKKGAKYVSLRLTSERAVYHPR